VPDEEGQVAGEIGLRGVLRAPTPGPRTAPVLRWTRPAEEAEAAPASP
jgi:hypothetical protein